MRHAWINVSAYSKNAKTDMSGMVLLCDPLIPYRKHTLKGIITTTYCTVATWVVLRDTGCLKRAEITSCPAELKQMHIYNT